MPRFPFRRRYLLLPLTFAVTLGSLAYGGTPTPPLPHPQPAQVLERAAKTTRSGMSYPQDRAMQVGDSRHCSAPRLEVATAEGKTEALPLKSTSAQVHIAGAVAGVELHQVFENSGNKPIEALYVFPASTRAAVHAMRMTIGTRTIEATIQRKGEARATFENARQAGQRASLLEEERPNVFTMRVTNIMPHDRIDVTLSYSELLVPEDATYEFVYPTVVGPRYTGGMNTSRETWTASPTLPEGHAAPYSFAFSAHVEAAVPIKEITSPSHAIVTKPTGPTGMDVSLTDATGGNRDVVLRYRLSGDRIETGALLAPPDAANDGFGTFAVMMEPPARPAVKAIPAREYLFLLDVSGSMHGFPLDTAKELMRKLLSHLRPVDTFNVALFSGSAHVMEPNGSIQATSENVHRAIEGIEREHGGGGTELMGGLEMTYRIPKKDVGISRTVVVVTDGYVGVEAQAFRFVREHLGDANLFAFGIGSSVNRALIEGMARAGLGEPFIVLNSSEAAAQADKLRTLIEQPVLTHIAVKFNGIDVSNVSPQVVPDLLARRPLVILGQYRGEPRGSVVITGLAGGKTPFRQEIAIDPSAIRSTNAPLLSLWARRWVATMEDEHHLTGNAGLEEGITAMGLRYHLLTPFTSFVAVDSVVVNARGTLSPVTQPLPLPEGVSNLAVSEHEMAAMKSAKVYRPGSVADSIADLGAGGLSRLAGVGRAAPPPASPVAATPSAAPRMGKPIPSVRDDFAPRKDRNEEKAAASSGASSPKGAAKPETDKNDVKQKRSAAFGGHVTTTETWAMNGGALRKLQQLLARSPACGSTAGAFVMTLKFDAEGRIASVVWTNGDSTLRTCVEAQLQGVTLPNAKGKASLVISWTFSS